MISDLEDQIISWSSVDTSLTAFEKLILSLQDLNSQEISAKFESKESLESILQPNDCIFSEDLQMDLKSLQNPEEYFYLSMKQKFEEQEKKVQEFCSSMVMIEEIK